MVSPYAQLGRKSRPISHRVPRYGFACLSIKAQSVWTDLRYRRQEIERVFRAPVPSTDDFKPESQQPNGSIENRADSGQVSSGEYS